MKKQNPNDIKIIFTDLDGTLLDHSKGKHKFDKASIRALKKAQKNGVLVYVATARPYDSLLKTGFLDLIKPDGYVCTNGATAFVGDKIVRNDIFSPEETIRIINICKSLGVCVEVSTEKDRYFTLPANSYVEEYFKIFHETYPPVKKYKDENCSALLLFAPKELDNDLERMIGRKYDFLRFTGHGVDLRKHPVYKTHGINDVLNYLGIPKERALSIGDEDPDVCMFEWTGFSACVGDANEFVKYKAKYVAKPIKKHGVKDALKYYKVI